MSLELSESLAEYRERWLRSLPPPAVSPWQTPAADAPAVLDCTCDLMLLMRAGCQCGTMRQEREADRVGVYTGVAGW